MAFHTCSVIDTNHTEPLQPWPLQANCTPINHINVFLLRVVILLVMRLKPW